MNVHVLVNINFKIRPSGDLFKLLFIQLLQLRLSDKSFKLKDKTERQYG